MATLKTAQDLAALRDRLVAARRAAPRHVAICSGTGCLAARSGPCAERFADELEKRGLSGQVSVRRTGCFGLCERGPIVTVEPQGTCYFGVTEADVAEIVDRSVVRGEVVDRLLLEGDDGRRLAKLGDIPFYRSQRRELLDANTRIDPRSVDDYIAIGGYAALVRALTELRPEQIIEEIELSGLRGRGGGGFPTGRKWKSTRNAPGDVKYVIVNADEGDPGAYMDRSLLEGNPHAVLEGLLIGAIAIGARHGYVYVRQEYPVAVVNTRRAVKQLRDYGLLGDDILGTGLSFDVDVHCGAGAFVSGESSALMRAIEGRVGQPRPKYVHTSTAGLWNRPSNLNNVETWANVPLIINRGADWFRGIGTEHSKGTKVFSLVGKVRNTGLVEVPMGTRLRDIVERIGGGVPGGKRLKAVQTGGPSGGFIPEQLLDVPVDFDELTRAGSMMGSGGMIVMDEDSCMVDAARFYVDFLARESCGQCVPCREGLRQMRRILDRLVAGRGRDGDVELLEELCELLQDASLCALGQSAPLPVLSALKHFRHEFEAHLRDRACPALACKELVHYEIDAKRCTGCAACKRECPTEAILGAPRKAHAIDQARCVKCGNCVAACPGKVAAVLKVPGPAPAVLASGDNSKAARRVHP